MHTVAFLLQLTEKQTILTWRCAWLFQNFFATAKRLPRRQVVDSDKKRAEDVLARRWHRVVACPSAVSPDLMSQFGDIFTANGEAWNVAMQSGLATFFG